MIHGIRFEDLQGKCLGSVTELLFSCSDDADELAPLQREAVCLRLGSWNLTVKAINDTSELEVSSRELSVVEPGCVIRDASLDEHFRSFVGLPLRGWWQAHNERGYADAFMLAFEEARGLCFVAMNNEVSVLTVAGEQWS